MPEASSWGTWVPPSQLPSQIVIFGAGETARLAWEYFTYDSSHEVVGFVVTPEHMSADSFCGLPVLTPNDAIAQFSPSAHAAFTAASSADNNQVRLAMYELALGSGYALTSYVSSRAFVASEVRIGANCFILENNVIQTGASIGNNTTLWSGNHVGHRSMIGEHVFISSHVVISGYCTVGDYCFLGVNSSMADKISLGPNCVLSLGSVLRSSTRAQGIYAGNPARLMPQRHERS